VVSPLRHQATLDGFCYKTHTGLRIGTSNSAPPLAILYLWHCFFFLLCTIVLHCHCFFSMLKFNATNRYKEMFLCHFLLLTTTQSSKFPQQKSNPHSQKKEFSFLTKKLWEQITHLETITKIHKM